MAWLRLRPEVPAACADLDLGLVERTLAKHYGFIPAAALELGVSGPDLRRLTWNRPELLEEAELECQLFVNRAMGILSDALHSDDPRRRMWAADKILSSRIASDYPLAPARRGGRSSAGDYSRQEIAVRFEATGG
jgi:hypothetical protein